MNVIIRLQELPWSATAMDIRKFFAGLHIPEGGVHIVGGSAGDAFIAFASDEDARQAMLLSGGSIHGSNVRLLLSSRTEMQKVIEVARTAPMTPSAPAPSPANVGAPQPFPGYPGPPMPMSVPTNAPSKNDDMHRGQGRSRSRSRSPRPRKRSTDSWGRGGAPAAAPVGNDSRLSLEVRGMPLWATVADLHELFSAFRVVPGGVRVFPSSEEPGTAVGIVRFVSPRVREEAYRRAPRKLRGQAQVVVLYADGNGDNGNGNCAGGLPERGSVAEDSSRRDPQLRARQHGKRVELSGLPFGFRDEDVRRFMKGCDIRSVYISHDDAGRPTGQAIVEMVSDADVVVALKLDREKLGNRTVQVNLATPGKRGVEPEPGGRNAEDEDLQEPTDCCLVQKLPHDATDRDVVHFFSETGVVPVTIHLMLNKGGQPSGDAFCVFQTADDCRRALKKRCGFVGNQFVHAQPVRREKMREALGHLPPFTPPDRGQIVNQQRRPQQEVYPRVQMNKPDDHGDTSQALPAEFSDRRQYPEGDRNREQGYPNVDHNMGQHADVNRNVSSYADVDRGIGQYPEVDRNRAQFVENDRGRANYPDVDHGRGGPYGDQDRNRGSYSEQNRAGMPDQRKSQGMRQPDRMSMSQLRQGRYNPRDPETFGNPGCVVSVTNIPYRAAADDIVAFFGEYKLSSDSVIRRFNDVGMPTGEARVAFKTRMDAESAVRSHNMKRMEGRPISVNFV